MQIWLIEKLNNISEHTRQLSDKLETELKLSTSFPVSPNSLIIKYSKIVLKQIILSLRNVCKPLCVNIMGFPEVHVRQQWR